MLSHLGFWTDNGAYYYGANHPGFNNSEQALKAVKADFAAREIPVRYFQWDDWWMMSDGDTPGMTSWTPKPTVFPSGFADWLDVPISMVGRNPLSNRESAREHRWGTPTPSVFSRRGRLLPSIYADARCIAAVTVSQYAPMYSANNVWINEFDWKVDDAAGGVNSSRSAIPVDPAFYLNLFRNGSSKVNMKMFEQDFLCTMNTATSLTNSDITSGHAWMQGMNWAAKATNTSLQWCM